MRKYLWLIAGISSSLLLPGCTGEGGGGGIDQFLKNPVIQIMIGIIVLWFVFKSSKKGE